jgi:hypothetical protein
MKRAILVITVAALAAACGQARSPNVLVAPAPAQAMDCVSNQLRAMGYNVVAQNPTAVRGEREHSRFFLLRFVGYPDEILTIDANTTAQQGQLTVTAFSQYVRGGQRQSAPPGDDAIRDAHRVVAGCT